MSNIVENQKSKSGFSLKSRQEEKNSERINIYSVILIYDLVLIFTAAVFYKLIPLLMNHHPDVPEIIRRLGSIQYPVQYIIIFSTAILLSDIFLYRSLKGINYWEKYLAMDNEEGRKKIQQIREKCIDLPYKIYNVQITVLLIIAAAYLTIQTALNGDSFVFIPKILVLAFSFLFLAGILTFVFSKRVFTKILLKTYRGEGLQGKRRNLKNIIFMQVLPTVVVAVLFTALLGYSRIVDEKAALYSKIYKNLLVETCKDLSDNIDAEQLKTKLSMMKVEGNKITKFIITPDNKEITLDGSKLSLIFRMYADDLALKYDGHVFSEVAEMHGTIIKLNSKEGVWTVGIKYEVFSYDVMLFFLYAFFALIALNSLVLYYFAKSMSGEISLVADNLTDIAEGEHVDLDRKLAVVSNDELGDLVIAFNKIQEKEKAYIAEREEQQVILMEQERLASLGQLIGGIAHNLRTPIMSLAGAIEGMKDLVKEYDASIEDPNVTKEDHHNIAKDMDEWLEKMKPHCSYMSDIITAVKEQTVQTASEVSVFFTVDEIAKRVDLLMNHELKKFHCKLKTEFNVEMNTRINGEVSLMVQVLNNLIINAIDSYEGTGGDINFTVNKQDNKVEFVVRDYGKGISEEVKEKLFKEMITTKGKKGTGLGLYMSYSNIKARFKGKMWFESEEGRGTTFHILVPFA